VRSCIGSALNLETIGAIDYCKSDKKPADIPADPERVYAEAGWKTWGDWLGTGSVANPLRKFRTFKMARAFVHRLGLKNTDDWRDYCNSGRRPVHIPALPNRVYAKAGWKNWGDWLGTGRVANRLKDFRAFKRARAFVHRLGFKSGNDWRDYCNSGRRPGDIPSNPNDVYEGIGWNSWGDWLGTGRIRGPGWRPFEKARSFVRRLGLNSLTWRDYCKSGKKPADIPANPESVYAGSGWLDWGDWLDTGRHIGNSRPFKKARAFVRRLGLKSGTAWRQYCRSGKKPTDIPAHPSDVYAKRGWAGMNDWLGTGKVAPGQHRPFTTRAFVRRLGLKSGTAWREYCRSGKKPTDIPAHPIDVYAKGGWAGMGDGLGNGRIYGEGWRHFKKARALVRRCGLKSGTAWREYCRSGKKPHDIPANPESVYAGSGWLNWGDWLGTGRVGPGQHRPFKKARVFVHRLRLKTWNEWNEYCKSDKKPNDIPAAPNTAYLGSGWVGMADWLGHSR
jgi:hypothetical protein